MSLFKRKKLVRPKNPLGMVLFQYDNIIKKELGGILKTLSSGKSMNPSRAEAILDKTMYKLDYILEDLSKNNLKIDYRSDKIRYGIINIIEDLKAYFKKAREYNFDGERTGMDRNINGPDKINEARQELKKKMKDIESDYL
ncbi:MAG TPA: hypothetical protein DCP02_03220 [Actinobacteria bacterium]|nr:hypothetical protein [Actinomycetota bacterium]